MAKKKVEITKSIALFDEEPPVKKAPVKVTKETKKKNDSNKNNNSNTSRVASRASNMDKQAAKETKTVRRGKQQSTSSADEKPRRSSKADNKDTKRVSTDKECNKRSTKSDKDDSSKGTTRRTKKESGTSRNTTSSVNKQGKTVDRPVSSSPASVEEKPRGNELNDIFKEAKKRKHKWTRGSEIMPPKQITGKPKVISDDLVAVIIDGEYYEVSPWSIRNGMYCQGFDSHFLVKYLHYEPVSTKYDEANAELAKIVETPKEEKKSKKKGSK